MQATASNNNSTNNVYFKDGAKYQQFRPTYPQRLMDKIRNLPNNHQNYLDIATGTGQVLFQLSDQFNNLVVGTDISDSQLGVARSRAEEISKNTSSDGKTPRYQFVSGDGNDTTKLLRDGGDGGINEKFDLITIGEAFHWFDMEKLLGQIRDDMLSENGSLAILSYVISDFELKTDNKELKKIVSDAYAEFYKVTTVYSKFSQEVLYSAYAKVPFDKYFSKIERDQEIDRVPNRKEDVVGHLGSWSMYGTYVEKHKGDADYRDPLKVFEEKVDIAIQKAKEEGSLNDEECPFWIVLPYSLVVCSNRK